MTNFWLEGLVLKFKGPVSGQAGHKGKVLKLLLLIKALLVMSGEVTNP